jgi:protein SCO1/2
MAGAIGTADRLHRTLLYHSTEAILQQERAMRRLLLVTAMVCTLAAAALVVMALRHAQASSAPPAARLEGTVVWPAKTRPAPSFALRDQQGKRIAARDLRGQVWAVTFLDSRCRQACPVAARALARVQQLLGARNRLKIVIISVLPRYDTPERVRAFARKTGLTGDWHWLLGSARQLAPVWQRYGIWVQSGVSHDAALYLVDQRGDVRVADAIPFRPSQLAASVRALTT